MKAALVELIVEALVGALVEVLVGSAGELVSKTKQAAKTKSQNKVECEVLARRVVTIVGVLASLPDPDPDPEDPEVKPQLKKLRETLRVAEGLVVVWRKRRAPKRLITARRYAHKFSEVNARIDRDLLNFLLVDYGAIAGPLFPADYTTPATTTTTTHHDILGLQL